MQQIQNYTHIYIYIYNCYTHQHKHLINDLWQYEIKLHLHKNSISNGFLRFKKDTFNKDYELINNENIEKILKKYSLNNKEEVIFI